MDFILNFLQDYSGELIAAVVGGGGITAILLGLASKVMPHVLVRLLTKRQGKFEAWMEKSGRKMSTWGQRKLTKGGWEAFEKEMQENLNKGLVAFNRGLNADD